LSKDIGERQDLATELPEKTEELLNDLIAWRKIVGANMPDNYKSDARDGK
jgi:hypothetical protein